jgi:hypothetical protein
MSKPTKEDASLFVQIVDTLIKNKNIWDAMNWFYFQFDAKTYDEFKEKYPMGSEGFANFFYYGSGFELIGILVNKGLLNEDLFFEFWGDLGWKKYEPIVQGLRKDLNMPRLGENFEVMAKKYPEWEKRNPPKV